MPDPHETLAMIDLDMDPNEASGLMIVQQPALLDAHGWDRGFWVVMDEGRVEDCIAVIGHRRGKPIGDGWDIKRLHAEPVGFTGVTEDAEALARTGGYVYVLGSHFGKKVGPLEPRRSFVARFPEAEVTHLTDRETRIEVARRSFMLHRVVNDALADAALDLVALGPRTDAAFIQATRDRGDKRAKKWLPNVREGDYPLNVEGAVFRNDGSLLLGLRFPTTADGRPILLALEGVERLFAGGTPEVGAIWAVDAVGRDGEMAGFRALTVAGTPAGGTELHLVTGNIDAREKDSVLLEDYPGGAATVNTHWACPLPEATTGGTLTPERVREFPTLPRIEGVAAGTDGTFFYVSDEDEGVHVRHTPLIAAG